MHWTRRQQNCTVLLPPVQLPLLHLLFVSILQSKRRATGCFEGLEPIVPGKPSWVMRHGVPRREKHRRAMFRPGNTNDHFDAAAT